MAGLKNMWRAAAAVAALWCGTALAQATPAGAPANPQTNEAMQQIHKQNVSAAHYAGLAAEKATSPKLKEFANKVVADHKRLDAELAELAKERGVKLAPEATITGDAQFKAGLDRLRGMPAEEFDKTYAQAAAQDREGQVAQLKRLRDETPGKDAKLKKWLDDAENVMEQHRNDARLAVKDVENMQRQGRTPAK